MRAILFSAFAAALCLSPNVGGAAEPVTSNRLEALIGQLSSSKFADRERADRELRNIGEPALKHLAEAAKSSDVEVRERALSTIAAIQRKIDNAKLLAAPKLRLSFDKTPLDQAIAELSKKTGLKYELDAKSGKNPKELITLDTGEVPFWEAVEKFLAAAGLTEITPAPPANGQPMGGYYDLGQPRQFRGGLRRSGPTPQPNLETVFKLVEAKSPMSASTGTLIRVKGLPREVSASSVVKGSNQLTLHLEVTPAPSLVWQGVVNVDIRKVLDDRGIAMVQSHTHNPLTGNMNTIWGDGIQIIQQGQAQIIIQGGGNVQVWDVDGLANPNVQTARNPRHIPVALLLKDTGSKSLTAIEGVITAEVYTPAQPIVVIENILKASAKDTARRDNYELQIEERTEVNDTVRVRFRMRAPLMQQVFAFQGGGFAQGGFGGPGTPGEVGQQVQLQDGNGTRLNVGNIQLMEQSFDGVTQSSLYTMSFSKKGIAENARLAVVGRRLATVEVPFALKNIPLP